MKKFFQHPVTRMSFQALLWVVLLVALYLLWTLELSTTLLVIRGH